MIGEHVPCLEMCSMTPGDPEPVSRVVKGWLLEEKKTDLIILIFIIIIIKGYQRLSYLTIVVSFSFCALVWSLCAFLVGPFRLERLEY